MYIHTHVQYSTCHLDAYLSKSTVNNQLNIKIMISASTFLHQDSLDPVNLRRTFLYQASQVLNHDEFTNLEKFLDHMSQPSVLNDQKLQHLLEQEYAIFIDKENLVVNNGVQSLSKWHGRPSSTLGLVLHSRTHGRSNGSFNRMRFQNAQNSVNSVINGTFWDKGSTIEAIEAKGIDKTSIFGFDWHWRALTWSIQPCRAKQEFGSAAFNLHEAFSRRVLEILPLPLLIVGGFCPRSSIQSFLQAEIKRITLPFSVNKENNTLQFDLVFDLVFETTHLRRLIVYTPHPSTIQFKGNFLDGYKLDAAYNLVMSFVGMKSDQTKFTKPPLKEPRTWGKIRFRQEIQRLYTIQQQVDKPLNVPSEIIANAPQYIKQSSEQVHNLLKERKLVRELYVRWCNNMQGKRRVGNTEIRSLDQQMENSFFSALEPKKELKSLSKDSGEKITTDHADSMNMERSIGTPVVNTSMTGFIPTHLLDSISANLTNRERSRIVAKYRLHTKIKEDLLSGGKRRVGKENQVCVRDHVNIKLPDEADKTNVKVKCFLAPEGQVHEHVCVSGNCVRHSDPSRRLAVAAIYQRNDDPNQKEHYKWGLWTQETHITILNSLVDTLEERTLEYTEKSSRRYLRRGMVAEGHSRYIFTA